MPRRCGNEDNINVGQEEEEEVEEEVEEVEEVGGRRGKDKPHHPLMISVQEVRIRPGKEKGKSDGWFPHLFGRKGVRGLGLLYPIMFRVGPETFGIIPIVCCSKSVADARK